ncbi:nuclear transport factor 2 family protein [Paraglaciecola marina]|uniref:nuclear transport factor 2 family protein n=1 Tax=Paraglaciecola marina TaxID=2500157 RepID=UPI00105EE32C|nr:nuclear transport factor 2 family protein [Paraglaciecola marina]
MNSNKIEHFVSVYQNLNKDNLALLKDIYHHDVVFIDPMHKVDGIKDLEQYFSHLYSNVQSITFNIDESIEIADKGFLYWTMIYCHPYLNGGKPINVTGHSRLTFKNGWVIFHQDYVDTNAMIFEYIPVIGRLIKHLKKRASK